MDDYDDEIGFYITNKITLDFTLRLLGKIFNNLFKLGGFFFH
jgi:hypothetical protein